jgi:hypothetical protein
MLFSRHRPVCHVSISANKEVHSPDLTGLCDIVDGTSYLEPDSVSEMTDESVSITQIQPLGERNARWYGWTHLPSAVNPSEAPVKFSPARSVPQTPRPRRDREDTTIMTSRREGLLNCIQQSARKQRRNAQSKSHGLEEALQSMTRSLDVSDCWCQTDWRRSSRVAYRTSAGYYPEAYACHARTTRRRRGCWSRLPILTRSRSRPRCVPHRIHGDGHRPTQSYRQYRDVCTAEIMQALHD